MEKKYEDEIAKNQKLENENKQLKESLKEKSIKEEELNKYKAENDKLKADLFKANKIITGLKQSSKDSNELKILREENTNLKYQLNLKDNEIINLKNMIQNNNLFRPKYDINDIMVINFVSTDIHYGIKCLPNDIFAEVEEKLYKKFDDLRDTNNMFTVNARPILRFKKLSENNIKDGDLIQLFKLE